MSSSELSNFDSLYLSMTYDSFDNSIDGMFAGREIQGVDGSAAPDRRSAEPVSRSAVGAEVVAEAVRPTHVELVIEGMKCASCARHVEEALRDVPSVRAVSVDLAASHAYVEAVDAIDHGALTAAVEEAGYTVYPAKDADSGEASHV
ncbi:Lead, cadmium, zinc and mercury transporting ATPase; Copper-translocating P-type ATPase [Caballeronia glathei]|uniref:Heavy metal transporter n=1 Tax=Caballeronia glathei TaxID=60547 RepID=A0A069PBG0_9BURK|nr:heavy metal-associated domain-containing protein [Caballeronia glathei]KDR37827.1 heavy metal transporter [Caballeronia glathei]CDY76162.1 Lead, cadmium, zinc and mercury transporting ATPase; Copper-translocating P-type ATPase [Caballeronia glathei]